MPLHGKLTSVGVVGDHGTGTGSLTITNTPISSAFRAFDASMDGLRMTCRLSHTTAVPIEEEVFEGVFTWSTLALTRDTVISSSNAGSKVPFSAGVKELGTVLTIEDVRRKPGYASGGSPIVAAVTGGDTLLPVGGGAFTAWRPSLRAAVTDDFATVDGTPTTLSNGSLRLDDVDAVDADGASPSGAVILTVSATLDINDDMVASKQIASASNYAAGHGFFFHKGHVSVLIAPSSTVSASFPAEIPGGLVTAALYVDTDANAWRLMWRSSSDSADVSGTFSSAPVPMGSQTVSFRLGEPYNSKLGTSDYHAAMWRSVGDDLANVGDIMLSDMALVESARTEVYGYRVEPGASSGTFSAAQDETVGVMTGTITVPAGLRDGWVVRRTNRSGSSHNFSGSGGLAVNGVTNGTVVVPNNAIVVATMVAGELDVQTGSLAAAA